MPQTRVQSLNSPATQPRLGIKHSGGVRTSTANAAIVMALTVVALYVGRAVFIPLATAVLVAFVLSPIVTMLRNIRVPRIVAAPVVVVATFALLLSIGALLSDQIRDLAGDLPRYEYTLREKARALRSAVTLNPAMEHAAKTLRDLQSELEAGSDKEGTQNASGDQGGNTSDSLTARRVTTTDAGTSKPIPVEIHYPSPGPFDNVLSLLTPLVEPTAMLALVVVLVLFMLMQKEELRDRLIRLTGAADMQRATAAMTDAGQRLSRFFLTMTALNVAYGILIASALWSLEIPAPILWGIFAALMRFVPILGSFIAAAFPVVLAAAVAPGWTPMLLTLGLFVVSEAVMGQVVEPLVQGRSTGLTPLAILVAAAFWTMLWGPVGLLLAIPITLCLVVIGQHVESLSFIHVMLGDEPAFSLPERFYQRTLAGDATEITELAEKHIKERSLISYYSEIAIGGLKLAQIDADRALIETEHMERIEQTVETMVDNLWEHADRTPQNAKVTNDASGGNCDDLSADDGDFTKTRIADLPVLQPEELGGAWLRTGSVLCVPAQTPIDRAAAHIISHLLYAHGIASEVMDGGDVQNHREENVDGRVQLICICSVSEQLAATRYKARRIARRKPEAQLFIALLGADQEKATAFEDSDLEVAGRVTVSLRDLTRRMIEHVSKDRKPATPSKSELIVHA